MVVSFDLGATVTGEVLNAEGERVPQARVIAMTKEQVSRRNPWMNEKVDEQSEEGDGTFALEGIPAVDMVLVVEADGYLEGRYELGEIRNGERREGIEIRLDQGNLVAGVVQWPDGTPARGALVRISQRGGFGGWDVERIMGEVKVGQDGKFQFSALQDGMCRARRRAASSVATSRRRTPACGSGSWIRRPSGGPWPRTSIRTPSTSSWTSPRAPSLAGASWTRPGARSLLPGHRHAE